MLATVLAFTGMICAAMQLLYYLFFFRRIASTQTYSKGRESKNQSFSRAELDVSVVICAKNEAENLLENLPFVLSQDYRDGAGNIRFEIIVVNDASNDHTGDVLAGFKKNHDHLSVIDIRPDEPRTFPGKKFALRKGIAAAKFPVILMTDADCKPASGKWIFGMSQPFIYGKEIVAGCSLYRKRPGVLNAFIRCETIHTFMQYNAYNLAGFPYMAVGRNLACKKNLLLLAQEHPEWQATASGDDDMLVQLCGTADNMAVPEEYNTHTESEAKYTVKEWKAQKRRHLSVGKYYQPKAKLISGIYAFTHAGFWFSLLMWLPFAHLTYPLPLGLLFIFMAIVSRCLMWMAWISLCGTIKAGNARILWPFFDFSWALYNLFFAPYILWKNKQTWK